jgi:hypothetical protein
VPINPLVSGVADDWPMLVTCHCGHRQGLSFRAGVCTNTSLRDDRSGRPLRMRADHSWPQRRHVYQQTTQVLSDVGSTGRPQTGHDIVAVADNVSNIQTCRATIVPALNCGRTDSNCSTGERNARNPSRDARNSAPRRREAPSLHESLRKAPGHAWVQLARLVPEMDARPCPSLGPHPGVLRCLLHASVAFRFWLCSSCRGWHTAPNGCQPILNTSWCRGF